MGFLRKLLAKIGKRWFWQRAEKMNLYVLALMARETVLKYQEIYEGDLERAVNTMKEQFSDAARSYLMDFMGQLNLILSRNLKDMEILSDVALWSILGRNSRSILGRSLYIPADDPRNLEHIDKFVTIAPKCVLCAAIRDLDLNRYKNLNYGEIIFGALGSLMELILNSMGFNYNLIVKETKCMLRGDPYSEATFYLYEKKNE